MAHKGILISIKVKNEFFAYTKKNPSNEFVYKHYKTYRNKLTHTIELSKKMHYEHLFDANKHNNNKVWKIINEIINYKNKKLGSIPDTIIDSNNKLQLNSFNISCAFNEYFANVGAKMASVISPKDKNKTSLPSLLQSLFLTPITEKEIIMQLNILNPNKSTAVNDIPIKFRKLSTCIIASILTSLYNRCLTEGNFPEVLKVAQITPIYKKGNKKTCSNY